MEKLDKPLKYETSVSQCQEARKSILMFFQDVPDPRTGDNCKHSFTDLLFMITMAIFSGVEDIADIR